MDSRVKIAVPAGHVTLLSLLRMLTYSSLRGLYQCRPLDGDNIYLYKGSYSPRHLVWKACDVDTPPPEMYNTSVLWVRFTSNQLNERSGFKLIYSFHKHSQAPAQGPGRLWNCSVPEWSLWQLHFVCNLERECEGGQDEATCFYSGSCGQDYLTLDNRCYFYDRVAGRRISRSWRDSNQRCQSKKGYLASLNHPQEWELISKVLDLRRSRRSVFLGLQTTPPSFPPLTLPVPFINCPDGHLTHRLSACDVHVACHQNENSGIDEVSLWGVPSSTSCPAPLTSLPAMFRCGNGAQEVTYSLVCDHQQQCDDSSDESFCVFPDCSASAPFKCGSSKQCVGMTDLCDGQADCTDASDEETCQYRVVRQAVRPPPPAVVHFTPHSQLFVSISPLPASVPEPSHTPQPSARCPETHFQCPGEGYCLPVFVRCNTILDCPHHEDEADCHTYRCPGLYRCYQSRACAHPSHVCDGVYHCPQKDDELFCMLPCPTGCTCHGHAFRCPRPFLVRQFPDLRFLDAGGSGMTPQELEGSSMLVHAGLRQCRVKHVHNLSLPNLQSLDLSWNHVHTMTVRDLTGVRNLQRLTLSGNPIESLLFSPLLESSFPVLLSLDLSYVPLKKISLETFSVFPNLQSLNFSHCGVDTIEGRSFETKALREIDFTGCPMTSVPQDLLKGLDQLQKVVADSVKLCCPVMLPDLFDTAHCQAPDDGLSSCEALLRSDLFRVFLSLFSALSLTGNLGCFLVRSFCFQSAKSGFGVFVTHLSTADFLMGVYLAVIGVADRLYLGSYVWEAESWRHSGVCQAAGFLSLLSSEVSAVIICLITLDRFLVLAFPFRRLHFQQTSAHLACGLAWGVFGLLSALPLLPATSHWSLYSQTGICMPLPVSSSGQAGHHYAFGILIVFNFVLFLLIATGQVFIFLSVRANSLKKTAASSQKSHEVQIARRLVTVVVSDFLCWFPVGLLGLLASQGHPLPGQVNVTVAIFVMPLNSALNPFLYTLNVVLQHRRRRGDEQLMKNMMARLSAEQELN